MAVDLLIIGGSGFIGARTAQAAQAAGLSVACTCQRRPSPEGLPAFQLDILDGAALVECLRSLRPRSVIYSAIAWDLASEEAQMRVSAQGVLVFLDAMRIVDLTSRLIYVSTNAVFSGLHGPYREDAIPDPQNRHDSYRYYGAARRAGEIIALDGWPETIVARTSNVDGVDAWGKLNPRLVSLVEPLRAHQPLARYVDRTISPTLVDSLAQALVEVACPDYALPVGRVLHLSGRQPVTDYEYARNLARRLGLEESLVREDHYLPPGSTGQYNIGLDTAFTQATLRTRLLDVDEMLRVIFP